MPFDTRLARMARRRLVSLPPAAELDVREQQLREPVEGDVQRVEAECSALGAILRAPVEEAEGVALLPRLVGAE